MRSIGDFIAFPGRVWVILACAKLAKLSIDFIGFIIADEGEHIFSKTDVFSKNAFISNKSLEYVMNTCLMIFFIVQKDRQ